MASAFNALAVYVRWSLPPVSAGRSAEPLRNLARRLSSTSAGMAAYVWVYCSVFTHLEQPMKLSILNGSLKNIFSSNSQQ
jgi:hypothetical protein